MSMGMGMSMEQRQEQRLEQRQSLTLSQRQTLLVQILQDLFSTIRGEVYRPEAKCPKCHHGLTTGEVLRGFNRDPRDFTTQCPKCETRFEARLVTRSSTSSVSVRLYCPGQALNSLQEFSTFTPEQILKENVGLYQSTIFHFGNLATAFRKAGIKYKFDNRPQSPKDKILPFLGKAPDNLIARVSGLSARTINRMRREQNIPPFRLGDE